MHAMPGAHRGQKKAFAIIKLEVQMAVNQHVVTENQIQVFCKSNKSY